MENKLNVLVTGSNGQLGSELKQLAPLHPNLTFTFVDIDELDITNPGSLSSFFKRLKPDFCINCAAYTQVDLAETEKEKAELINHHACQYLADCCLENQTVLIHISTDFVFDGTQTSPISEDEPAKPISIYGDTKRRGEIAICSTLDKHYIFRTSWLYSTYGKNFVKTMLRLSEDRDSLNVINDQYGTPTYAADLAEVIIKVINTPIPFGIYHYSNSGQASWYDFANKIFELSSTTIDLHPIPTTQYPTPAKRPRYSVLDKSKINRELKMEIPTWEKSLKKCLELLLKKSSRLE